MLETLIVILLTVVDQSFLYIFNFHFSSAIHLHRPFLSFSCSCTFWI